MAQVQKGVRIELAFTFAATDDGTRITETVEISGPWIVRKLLARELASAHRTMLASLAALA